MIATQQVDVVWMGKLQAHQVADNFDAVLSTVDIVTEEEHLRLLRAWLAELLHHCNHVVQLTMNVANDADFSFNFQEIWFLRKHFLGHGADMNYKFF